MGLHAECHGAASMCFWLCWHRRKWVAGSWPHVIWLQPACAPGGSRCTLKKEEMASNRVPLKPSRGLAPCFLLPWDIPAPEAKGTPRPRWAEAATFPQGGGPGKEGARALVLGVSSWSTLGDWAVLGVLLFPDLTSRLLELV